MRQVLKGSIDQSVVIRIVDSTDGTPETGVTAGTAGLDLKYRREGGATVNLTESDLATLTDAHLDGGMLHIGAGYYRIDVPDAAFASGANGVLIFGTVTNMVVIGCYIELVDFALAGQSAIDLKDFADDGYDPATNKVQGVVTVDALATNAITAASISADAITAAKVAADVGTEIATAVWAVANIAPSAMPSGTGTMKEAMSYWLHISITTHEVSSTEHRIRNTADSSTIVTHAHSDAAGVFQSNTGV